MRWRKNGPKFCQSHFVKTNTIGLIPKENNRRNLVTVVLRPDFSNMSSALRLSKLWPLGVNFEITTGECSPLRSHHRNTLT
jgi:hypothetical protein